MIWKIKEYLLPPTYMTLPEASAALWKRGGKDFRSDIWDVSRFFELAGYKNCIPMVMDCAVMCAIQSAGVKVYAARAVGYPMEEMSHWDVEKDKDGLEFKILKKDFGKIKKYYRKSMRSAMLFKKIIPIWKIRQVLSRLQRWLWSLEKSARR